MAALFRVGDRVSKLNQQLGSSEDNRQGLPRRAATCFRGLLIIMVTSRSGGEPAPNPARKQVLRFFIILDGLETRNEIPARCAHEVAPGSVKTLDGRIKHIPDAGLGSDQAFGRSALLKGPPQPHNPDIDTAIEHILGCLYGLQQISA